MYTGLGAYSINHSDVFSFTANQASLAQLKNAGIAVYGERKFLLSELNSYTAVFGFLQQLEQFRRNPINLNVADINELRELRILTDLQIVNLISYRRLLGKFINIYELQAIPAWDVNTLRKLLPFITIASAVSLNDDLAVRFKGGNHSLLFRFTQVMEKQKGFDKSTTGTKYQGTPQRLFFRYKQVEIYTRFRNESKQLNRADNLNSNKLPGAIAQAKLEGANQL